MNNPKLLTRRREFVQILTGTFLVLFSTRLALVLMFAPEIPFYDEWDALIDHMARPMLAGDFSLRYLLEPHNEHALLWTKGLSYLLLRVGDLQFDNVPVCEISQVIYAGTVATLIALAASRLTAVDSGRDIFRFENGRSWFVAAALLAAVLPYGWENIGTGWQNAYYFLLAFSTCTIILASVTRCSWTSLVLLGVVAVAAGASMGSGLFAAVAAMFALAMRVRIGSLSARAAAGSGAVLFLAALTAVMLIVHADRATIGWGLVQSSELAITTVLMTPTWILMSRIVRGRGSNADVAFVCVALFGLMQIGAILLGRPAFRLWYPISRYFDVLALAAFANLGCLFRLASAEPARRTWAWLSRAAVLATVAALLASTPFAWHWMTVRAGNQREQSERLIRYVQRGDAAAIEHAPPEALPYPARDRLRAFLDAADVRRILGDEVGTRAAPSAFVDNVRKANATLARNGAWLLPLSLAIGLLMLADALGARRRRLSASAPRPIMDKLRR